MYNEAKSELADIEAENNREVEAMLESIRDLQKGLQLNQLITHRYESYSMSHKVLVILSTLTAYPFNIRKIPTDFSKN